MTIITMEVSSAVISALKYIFPSMNEDTVKFMKEIHTPNDEGHLPFKSGSVLKAENYKKLFNTMCITSGAFCTMSKVSEMTEVYLCFVYVRDEVFEDRETTPVMLSICHRIPVRTI